MSYLRFLGYCFVATSVIYGFVDIILSLYGMPPTNVIEFVIIVFTLLVTGFSLILFSYKTKVVKQNE